MSENREEILANFQGITAIEDVAEAIYILDAANWDLLAAINRVMPQDGSQINVNNSDDNTQDVEFIEDDVSVITSKASSNTNSDRNNLASTSSTTGSNIYNDDYVTLNVDYNNKVYNIRMTGSSTVQDLKKRLEEMCGVPLCRQQISGLGGSRAISTATLSGLNLPKDANIRLKAADESMADDEVADRLTSTYVLKIKHNTHEYTLSYPGTKTVQEVKGDVYSMTDIPARLQVWTGWPEVNGLDCTVLAMVGLNLPEHHLTVARAAPKQSNYKKMYIDSSESEDSSIEFEDAENNFPIEEDMFVDIQRPQRLQPLLPDCVTDEAIGCIEFAERFRERYGQNTPSFFQGNLQDAIKEACLVPASQRRLLGVYLHHDGSVLSNVFCAQLLGCDMVLQTLATNFLLYGWDMTVPSNRNMFISSFRAALGDMAAMTVQSIPVERLPTILIIMRVKSNTEIYSVINGNVDVSELLSGLMESVERFTCLRAEDEEAEREREARQKVKREQDEAYQLSLQADRAKEEIKKQQEFERNQEIERVRNEQLQEEARQQSMKLDALSRVPSEPDTTEDVCRIRIRLAPPEQRLIERRFRPSETLANLLDFLASQGYPQESFKVISSWPRRDLTTENSESTLKSLKLYPQETIMLEER